MNKTVYMKCDRNVESREPDVFLKDVAEVHCEDKLLIAKCNAIKVYHFGPKDKKRVVISSVKLIDLVEQSCPGVQVEVLGETDLLLEWVDVNRHKGPVQWCKAALVCLVSFFGTAFTIMAYHNDIGINNVFERIYFVCMGREAGPINVLEISYSIGLALGIIVFFNHIGGRRLTKDPTPIEVAMRNYEKDVDMALIETAEREGKEIS